MNQKYLEAKLKKLISFKIQAQSDDAQLDLAVLQAAVFLEDAHNFRSIYHKIDRVSLVIYRFYYSKPVQM